MYIGLSVSRNL